MDAGNMIKPMLARGELRADRRDHARRVPQVHREGRRARAPLPAGATSASRRSRTPSRILRGLKERYEVHHGVRIQDAALVAAAVLSRPLHHRPLPARQGHRPRSTRPPRRLRIEIDSHADRDRRGRAAHPPARDRAHVAGARRPTTRRSERLDALDARARRPAASSSTAMKAALAGREGRHRRRSSALKERARAGAARRRARRARGRPRAGGRDPLRRDPRARAPHRRGRQARSTSCRPTQRHAEGGGRRRGHRRGRRQVDRRPRVAGCMEGEMAKLVRMEERAAPAGRRPGRGGRRGRQRHPPLPRRPVATPTGRSARSCSSARPASARPSWPARWPSSCSTTSERWSAST